MARPWIRGMSRARSWIGKWGPKERQEMTRYRVQPSGGDAKTGATAESHSRASRALQGITVWLFTAFVFLLPTDLRFGGDKSLAMRIGYLCVFLGVVAILKRRTLQVPPAGFWFLFGFVLWSSCTLLWARYPAVAEHKLIEYWRLFIIVAVFIQYAWQESVRQRLMDAYVAGCWIGVMGLFFHFIAGTPYLAEGELEFEGRYTFGTDPNYLALALVIGIPLALYGALKAERRWQKWALLSYVPAGFAGLLLTGSRGAWVTLLAIVLLSGLMLRGRVRALVLGTVVLLVAAPFVLPGQVMERMSSIPDELRYGSLSDRTELWQRGSAVVMEHPLNGIGVGAAEGMMSIAAHNTPLELTMESGAIGLLLFYAAWAFSVRGTWKADHREGLAATFMFFAWFVGSASLSWEVNGATWYLLAILIAAGSARRTSAEVYRIPRTAAPAYLPQ